MPLHPSAQRLLRLLPADPDSAPDDSAPDRRRSLLALTQSLETDPTPVRLVVDTAAPSRHGQIGTRIYDAAPPGELAGGLVYFHGGGWVAGDLDTHDGFCRRLAAGARCKLLAIDYRLAPEHPFPAALDDCVAAFEWASERAADLGLARSRLAIGGDSTGAGLAAAASALLRDAGGPCPVGQLLVCPVLAPGRRTGSRCSLGQGYFAEAEVIDRDLRRYCSDDVDSAEARVSPLLASNFSNLPPTIVHTAEFDPFTDEGQDYVAALLRAGVPASERRHAGMIHYFYALPRAIPYAMSAAAMMASDLSELIRGEDA
jgi:acetyl esterase/lipase